MLRLPFDLVTGLGFGAFVLLLLALPIAFWSASAAKRMGVVQLLVALANLLLTAQLVLRWWESGHFPISNLYESLCFLAWACTLTQLLVERTWPSPIVPAATCRGRSIPTVCRAGRTARSRARSPTGARSRSACSWTWSTARSCST